MASDLLPIYFQNQWKVLRGLTHDLLLSIPDEELELSPAAEVGPWWKQFRHVGRVQENYLDGLESGVMKFGLAASYGGGASKAALGAYLEQLDRRMESMINDGVPWKGVDWFGENKSIPEHLMRLAEHEQLHHGQWIVYRRLFGGPFPKSWQVWGL